MSIEIFKAEKQRKADGRKWNIISKNWGITTKDIKYQKGKWQRGIEDIYEAIITEFPQINVRSQTTDAGIPKDIH